MERSMTFRTARKKPYLSFSIGELLVTIATGSIALFVITVGSMTFLNPGVDYRFLIPIIAAIPALITQMGKKRSALYFSLAFTLALLYPCIRREDCVYLFDSLSWPLFIAQSVSFLGLFYVVARKALSAKKPGPANHLQSSDITTDSEICGLIIKGRYRIQSLLGAGASGSVYLVNDLESPGEKVQWAVKEISPMQLNEDGSDDAGELFRCECAVLKSLNHLSIPKLIDSFSWSNRLYMVMEHVQGESAEAMMKKSGRPLDAAQVLGMARELSLILQYLHEQIPAPLIYRDLKPSNIVITEKGKLRLIDFGIARYHTPEKTKDTYVYGTPGFSPPEQYGIGQTDERSDIYALGATLYYLLTREDICQFHFIFPKVTAYNRKVPRPFEALIMKCLSRNPDDRYQNTSELLSELSQIEKAHHAVEEAGRKEISWVYFFIGSILLFMLGYRLAGDDIMLTYLKIAAVFAIIALVSRAAVALKLPGLALSLLRQTSHTDINERRVAQ
ncbi:MAG: serine/threonine protein kinase [Vulcanimicrobiota bacterium]